MTLGKKIEAILFIKGEPVTFKKLAGLLGVSEHQVTLSLTELDQSLAERGLQLVYTDDAVMLGTRAELGPILEQIRREELNKELSKATQETLAIILYKKGATRAEIDYVRGVNSSFILRNLLIRGLIEKIIHPKDSRRYFYKPTIDLLSYLGISRIEDLPEFNEIAAAVGNNLKENE